MKNKILVLLLLFGTAFTFVFTSSKAQSEFVDNDFIISNLDYNINEEDSKEFMLYLYNYVVAYDLGIFYTQDNLTVAELKDVNFGGLYIDFNADLPNLDYTFNFIFNEFGYSINMLDYNQNTVFSGSYLIQNDEFIIRDISTSYSFSVIITLGEIPEVPPFTGLINFISNFLQDLLKSITDMTMHLINNIWDTNLIDINLVILSDTAIYTGTLNDLLYSVFSIFYVIFAITFVWRLLKKLLRKVFYIVRW